MYESFAHLTKRMSDLQDEVKNKSDDDAQQSLARWVKWGSVAVLIGVILAVVLICYRQDRQLAALKQVIVQLANARISVDQVLNLVE